MLAQEPQDLVHRISWQLFKWEV